MEQTRLQIKVAAVSLGCPKNQVDTEKLLGALKQQGLSLIEDPETADWIVINTCSFIRSAEEETIQALLEAAAIKGQQKDKRLIVVGCIVKKYGEKKLRQLIPEIDLALPPAELDNILSYTESWCPRQPPKLSPLNNHSNTRFLLSGPGTAFLKITEGCSRKCAFCLIPQLRGPLLSTPIDAIVGEAEKLVKQGAKELVVVAQDTAGYGRDLKGSETLTSLVDRLVKINKLRWLRLMYMNPDSITDGLIQRMAAEKKICKYLDMPIQHSQASILKRMKRSGDGTAWLKLIKKIRKQIPSVSLRTTVLTGFPGETEKDHRSLMAFIKQACFDRLGAFAFSKEAGTAAAAMANQVHYATKLRRWREIMALQEIISQEQLRTRVGTQVNCLVEELSGKNHVIARTMWDAPEIDGAIILKGKVKPGQFVKAIITGATIHDLTGDII